MARLADRSDGDGEHPPRLRLQRGRGRFAEILRGAVAARTPRIEIRNYGHLHLNAALADGRAGYRQAARFDGFTIYEQGDLSPGAPE